MTLATRAAPLNIERRDTSVSGTRAVVSSQQLMGTSKSRCGVHSKYWKSVGVILAAYCCSLQRSSAERSCLDHARRAML
jgi:hypothetical protein